MAPSVAAVATVSAYLCVAIPYAVLAFVGVHRKKNEFPWNGRELALLIPYWMNIFPRMIYYPVAGLFDEVPCIAILVIESNLYSLGLVALVLRCLRLLFLHEASQALMVRHNKRTSEIPTWFVDHRHYVSRSFLLKVLASWTLLMVAVSWILYAFGPSSVSPDMYPHCPTLRNSAILILTEGLIAWMFLIVTAWRLHGMDDAYQIKQEIIYLVGAGALIFAVNFVRRIPSINASMGLPFTEILISLCLCVSLGTSTWFPLFLVDKEGKSRHNRKQRRRKSMRNFRGRNGSTQYVPDESESGVGISNTDNGSKIDLGSHIEISSRGSLSVPQYITLPLEALLLDKAFEELRHDFEKHLSSEFAFENLLFWAETGHFSVCYDNRTAAEIAQHAVELYNDFVRLGAPYQANLNSAQVTSIEAAVTPCLLAYERDNPSFSSKIAVAFDGVIAKDIFDKARAGIYRLMAQGAYIRWQQKNGDVIKKFLKENPTHQFNLPSPSSNSVSQSMAYYSLTHKSLHSNSRPPSMRRERYNHTGGVASTSQSFLGAAKALTPTSFASTRAISVDPPESPSHSRKNMLVHHARGPSDASTLSGFSERPDSPTASSTQHMLAGHQRIASDASSLGISEKTQVFNFAHIPADANSP